MNCCHGDGEICFRRHAVNGGVRKPDNQGGVGRLSAYPPIFPAHSVDTSCRGDYYTHLSSGWKSTLYWMDVAMHRRGENGGLGGLSSRRSRDACRGGRSYPWYVRNLKAMRSFVTPYAITDTRQQFCMVPPQNPSRGVVARDVGSEFRVFTHGQEYERFLTLLVSHGRRTNQPT